MSAVCFCPSSLLSASDVGSSSTLIGYCEAYERKKFNFLNSSYARICTRVYVRAYMYARICTRVYIRASYAPKGTATPKALPAYHAYKIGNFSIGNHWFTRVWDAYERYMRISNILLALGAYEARIYTRVYIRAYIYARTRSSKNWNFLRE